MRHSQHIRQDGVGNSLQFQNLLLTDYRYFISKSSIQIHICQVFEYKDVKPSLSLKFEKSRSDGMG